MLVCQPSVYGLAGFPPQALATHQFLSAFGSCLPSNLLHRVDDAWVAVMSTMIIIGGSMLADSSSQLIFGRRTFAFQSLSNRVRRPFHIQVLSLVPSLVIALELSSDNVFLIMMITYLFVGIYTWFGSVCIWSDSNGRQTRDWHESLPAADKTNTKYIFSQIQWETSKNTRQVSLWQKLEAG